MCIRDRTGIACQLLFGPGLDAHSLKPAVERLSLAALGKKQVKEWETAAGMLHPGAVTLQRQQGFACLLYTSEKQRTERVTKRILTEEEMSALSDQLMQVTKGMTITCLLYTSRCV